MGHFFSKVSLFIDKKEAAAHLILDQDFATAPNLILFVSKQSEWINAWRIGEPYEPCEDRISYARQLWSRL